VIDYTTVIQAVDSWPVEDRLRLVESLWDRIVDAGEAPPLTETQRAELDRRLAAIEANPDDVASWEEVQRSLRRAG
jgi:putative addiction module component (TIGR02574 family)